MWPKGGSENKKIMQEITALVEWTIKELRAQWHEIHEAPPPPKMSRDLLTRAVAHHLQEASLGSLDRKAERRLRSLMEGLGAGGEATTGPASGPRAASPRLAEHRPLVGC